MARPNVYGLPRHLTNLQQKFIVNYLANGGNAYRAAIDAGYSESFASTGHGAPALLKLPHIQARIAAAKDNSVHKMTVSYDWKIEQLVKIIESTINGDEHCKAVTIKAIAELNKMQGDYAPDRVMRVTVDATAERFKQIRKEYDEY